MAKLDIATDLQESLSSIAHFLEQVPEAAWAKEQNGKWTIAQETGHILKATQGTAALFTEQGRATWRPTDQISRSYDTIKDSYLAALAKVQGLVNPATAPSDEANQKTPAEQLAKWQKASALLLQSLEQIADEDLDKFSVWKHPLLGPFTAREMLFFTAYHTRHHYEILHKKQEA